MKGRSHRSWPIHLGLALLALTLLSAPRIAGLSAKYIMQDNGVDSTRAAVLDFDLANGSGSAMIDLSGIQKPGDSEVYRFNVTGSSEVSMRYWIGLALNGSMPLECVITRDSSTVVSTTLAQLTAAVPDSLPLTAASSPVTIAPNPAEAHSYTLTVTWPGSASSLDYANNSVAELTLEVLAEQVD